MIGRLNHVAIAVRDIGKAAAVYRDVLGADVSGAVPQGLAAAWSTYVVGNAANVYFRDAGWGGRSPKEIVQEILTGAETQKTSILASIRDQLKAKFGR